MYEELLIPIEDVSFVKDPSSLLETKWKNSSGEIWLYGNQKESSWSWIFSLKFQKKLSEKDMEILKTLYDSGMNKGFFSRKEAMKSCLEVITSFKPDLNISQEFVNLSSRYLLQIPGYLDCFNEYKYTGVITGTSKRGWKMHAGNEMGPDLYLFKSKLNRYTVCSSRRQIIDLIYNTLNQHLKSLYNKYLYQQAKPIFTGESQNNDASSHIDNLLWKAWWIMFTKPEVDLTTVF